MAMKTPKFTWGPLARGLFTALLSLTAFVQWVYPEKQAYYLFFLAFLALGLRPLLEITGLYDLCVHLQEKISARKWDRITEQRRREIEQRERLERARYRRARTPERD